MSKDSNMDGKKNKGDKKLKKPNPFFYYMLYPFVWIFIRPVLRTSIDRKALKNLKGPAFVVCNHSSNIDYMFAAAALMPHRPNFIVSQHFMNKPKTRWILKLARVIPKKMFSADINAMRQILRAKDSGNIVVIYPEGRLSCYGRTLRVTDGTAELIKKLGIDVYLIKQEGAYKTLPKWGKSGFRRGKIQVSSKLLFDGTSVKDMEVSQISSALDEAIYHDDDLVLTEQRYRCKAPALGLDGILYKCPSCHSEFQMFSDEHHLTCRQCGLKAKLDESYKLTPLSLGNAGLKELPFSHINSWFEWQESLIDLDVPLSTPCKVASPDAQGNTDRNAGEGVITMTRDNISFSGRCWGQPLEFSESTAVVKGFPATVGDHFDIYSKNIMYHIIPQPDPRLSIKWVAFLDKLTKESSL